MSKGGGGGGGVQQTESVVTQTNLPEYAKPFYEEMLGRTVYESTRPYETYQGTRIADFSPFETTAMTGMAEMAAAGAPQQIRSASDIATQIGFQPTNMGTNIAAGFNPQQQFSNYQAGTIASGYTAPTDASLTQGFEAGTLTPTYAPGTIASDYAATTRDSGYTAGQIDPGYAARDVQSQYTGQADFGPGFQAGTVADAATLQSYMNPYQQLVTDIEAREAKRASDKQAAEIAQQAAMAGGLGGYREAILQSERERNLSQQLADIQARGGQAAFAQAQKAFEADRAARLQQAQLGLRAGTEQQRALQQAEQLRQAAFGTSEQARQQAAKIGLSAQQQEEAARQAQEQFNQRSFEAGEKARQTAAQLGLSAQQQQEAANQAAQRFRSEAFAENQRGRLAQQQEARAVFEARERARQQAAQLGLSAAETQERMDQAQNQAAMAAREFNVRMAQERAQLGLAGLQADQAGRGQALDAARLLSSLGGQEQAMAFDRLRNLQAAGEIQRGLDQRSLDLGYQDFLRQQAFPREQIGFFSNILQGLPVTPGSTMASFGVQPTTGQQLLGAGISGVGLYNALGRG